MNSIQKVTKKATRRPRAHAGASPDKFGSLTVIRKYLSKDSVEWYALYEDIPS